MARGFLIAAPQSGSGKTTITLGILRAMRNAGLHPSSAKAGPDFIDPAFHGLASGQTCINLDPWAMRPALVRQLAASFGQANARHVGKAVGQQVHGAIIHTFKPHFSQGFVARRCKRM